MANAQLVSLPELVIPATGSKTYIVEGGQSFQGTLDLIANFIITNKDLLTSTLPAGLMTTGNAQLILDGLNNAQSAKLQPERINVDFDAFISGYFDIDGGTFYDTYANASTFDGGGI
jgi:hypothetical protein